MKQHRQTACALFFLTAAFLLAALPGYSFEKIQNRWKPDQYLNIENGTITSGPIQSGWWNAQWNVGSGAVRAPLPRDDGFYVIAHMTNTPQAALWAVRQGANALEIDLAFDAAGRPTKFYHGGLCDCACARGVCSQLDLLCEAQSGVSELLAAVASLPVPLVIIDSKVTDLTDTAFATAGRAVVQAVERDLFGRGFRGQVMIGAPKNKQSGYLRAAAEAAKATPNRNFYFFSTDQMGDDVRGTLRNLVSLPSRNRAFGTGISACAIGDYRNAIATASGFERSRASAMTYIWTIDSEKSMRSYIAEGARGIITNYPSRLAAAARSAGKTPVQMGRGMVSPASDMISGGRSDCDCDYRNQGGVFSGGGCRISSPAPAGKACKCRMAGAWTCGGSVTSCKSAGSSYCRAPDVSKASCQQGGGDCDGY